ncbi:MAG: RepB family DNA primase [Anaerolineae bacterium]|nr:RepB family DNA primase [Anaerolineae bacterium]NUQ06636.1 hypothetical protein [Anaerolineae bacterium]
MRDERDKFFAALLARCSVYPQTRLTLTAIYPDGKHRTPSRHVPVNDIAALQDALERLDAANCQEWGAYFAVGLRRPGLNRWQRGGTADVVALPALFVDVDDPSPDALERLQSVSPAPSCMAHSGGGYHAYWWLDTPTTDLETARRLLRGLAAVLRGDILSVAQSLRVPSTMNTKPSRHHACCHLIELHERRYTLADFTAFLPVSPESQRSTQRQAPRRASPYIPDPDLIAQLTHALLAFGCKPRGDWLNGACPFPGHHKHNDQHPSFGFNTRTGYGFCHVCGTLLLKDLCVALGIQPAMTPEGR